MNELVGVIPAAGRGTRAYPYTKGIPKCMLEVDGRPNLEHLIGIMRDQMGIRHVVVIVATFRDVIIRHFGDGSRFGVKLTYVQNHDVDKGLSHSILLSQPYVSEHFCVMLSDECYIDSNHHELVKTDYASSLATCAIQPSRDQDQVRKNYSVEIEDGLIRRIVEKPQNPGTAMLGLGTFVFHRRFFAHLERALAATDGLPKDPVSVLGRLCAQERVAPFVLQGEYVNINDRDEFNLANNLVRIRDFERRPLSLAMLSRGSLDDTFRSLADFQALGRFNQIVLVVPPNTDVSGFDLDGATLTTARSAEYGDMLRTGFDACSGDILCAVESDGSFSPRDVPKFLEYLKEADLVVGTRTTKQLVHQGTNMRGIVRLGHVALAKVLEIAWRGYGPSFTDVGCTYRAIWASTYRLIRPNLAKRGPEYAVELLLETLKCRKRVVEIPVNFRLPRKGIKKQDQSFTTAFRMLSLILVRRLRSTAAERPVPASAVPESLIR
ncbi:MAG TPA: sugar phosphate nucleotidyltransferase [Vicinamibacterales bacterium]|nr:sugar phosphate nucleotidyltransferase [Vicinamibacterales bacterium]